MRRKNLTLVESVVRQRSSPAPKRQILEIRGEPIPKQSTRFGRGHAYPDPRVEAYARRVQLEAMAQYIRRAEGYVAVTASFYLGDARRVDCDNLWKMVGDALEGVAWDDDSNITDLSVHKALSNPNPRTVVTIERMEP